MARLGQDKFVVYKLFEEIAARYAAREGGHTRILKLGPRKSDSTEMASWSWFDQLRGWPPGLIPARPGTASL